MHSFSPAGAGIVAAAAAAAAASSTTFSLSATHQLLYSSTNYINALLNSLCSLTSYVCERSVNLRYNSVDIIKCILLLLYKDWNNNNNNNHHHHHHHHHHHTYIVIIAKCNK